MGKSLTILLACCLTRFGHRRRLGHLLPATQECITNKRGVGNWTGALLVHHLSPPPLSYEAGVLGVRI